MLLERIFCYWRVLATGLAFCIMGLGSLVLAAIAFPIAAISTADRSSRRARVQHVVHIGFQTYVTVLRLLGIIRLEVVGAKQLASCRGMLIVANHPTLLDVVLLMSQIPHAQCVVKHQLWKNLYLGPIVRAAGYIRNDQPAEIFIEQCREAFRAGSNLIIFPEGTRSTPGQPLRFQRGFANVALLTETDILPLRITCEPITLTKGNPWYNVPQRRPLFRVTVAESIAAGRFLAADGRARGARKLVAFLESHYRNQEEYGRA